MSEKENDSSRVITEHTFHVFICESDGTAQEVGHSTCVDTVFKIARKSMRAHGALIVKVTNCPSGERALVIHDAANLVPFSVRIAGCCIALVDDPFVPDPNYRDYVSLVEDLSE